VAWYVNLIIPRISMSAVSDVSLEIDNGIGSAGILSRLDPYITIDPDFPFAGEFTLVFSPFIKNDVLEAAAIPEPASRVVFLTALLGLYIIRRGRAARLGSPIH
jgi:hypothetical protein